MSGTKPTTDIFKDLTERGLIHSVSDEDAIKKVLSSPTSLYCGFDPTAESLHVGSLLAIITLIRLAKSGHKPVLLLGTATGMIGDPSGKSEERNLLDNQDIRNNADSIKKQLSNIFSRLEISERIDFVENLDWFGKISLIEFLRDIGKHFSVNQMCAKDSVKNRLENREQGISYTEFSYMTFQAYDFLELFKEKGCKLQVGGSDQWGNITEGIELVRRKLGKQALGLTFPLLLGSDGQKFGKTAKGAVWLNEEMTSPYEFYQYWINRTDEEASTCLHYFSFLEIEEISELLKEHQTSPEKRLAQTQLAEELTALVHGVDAVEKSKTASRVLFGGSLEGLSASDLISIFKDVPSSQISESELGESISILELLPKTTLAKSKGEAKRLIAGGGLYLNNERVNEPDIEVKKEAFLDGQVLLLRSGKKKYELLSLGSS